jgi:hypothetical protein
MALFRSKHADTLESLGPKIEAARGKLAAVEAELRERAVDVSGEEDPGAALAVHVAAVTAARETVNALEMAEAELHRRERQRLADARVAAEKARINAHKAHARAATNAAADLRASLEQANAAWRELLRYVDKSERLLHGPERDQLIGPFVSTPATLARLVIAEVARINGHASDYTRFPLAPKLPSYAGQRHGMHVSELPPLDTVIAAKLDLPALLVSPGYAHLTRRDVEPPAAVEPAPPPVACQEPERAAPDAAWATIPQEITDAQAVLRDPDAAPEARAAAEHAVSTYGQGNNR